jgi:quercetin dioxygenase-like cupin family protein
MTRSVTGIALLALFLLTWGTQTDQDAVGAQTRAPIMASRIYTGTDGQSHSEEIEIKITNGNNSDMLKATGVQFRRQPPGYFNDWHPGPRRQLIITLSGRGEMEVAGGRKIDLVPGRIELIEDLTGKGHITRVVGKEDRVSIAIPLADQTLGAPLR